MMREFFERAYRVGSLPWEDAAVAGQAQLDALLARELTERDTPPGRALDVGCGRGMHAVALAASGWRVSAVDYVPAATSSAATMLLLAFAPGAPPPLPQGVERSDLDEALPAWQVVDSEPVPTEGLPFPQVPVHWYRLRRRDLSSPAAGAGVRNRP